MASGHPLHTTKGYHSRYDATIPLKGLHFQQLGLEISCFVALALIPYYLTNRVHQKEGARRLMNLLEPQLSSETQRGKLLSPLEQVMFMQVFLQWITLTDNCINILTRSQWLSFVP